MRDVPLGHGMVYTDRAAEADDGGLRTGPNECWAVTTTLIGAARGVAIVGEDVARYTPLEQLRRMNIAARRKGAP